MRQSRILGQRSFTLALFFLAVLTVPASMHAGVGELTANGSAMIVTGPHGSHSLLLTPNENSQAGTVFTKFPVPFGEPFRFHTFFQFSMSDPGGIGAADGITFTLQTESPTVVGEAGGSLGYGGILPSVGVSFVTFQNSYDIAPNAVGVVTNGNNAPVDQHIPYGQAACLSPTGVPGCMGNGDTWSVWIDYDGAVLRVALADSSDIRPPDIIEYPINIARTLEARSAYVGFTSATGNGVENHRILFWKFLPF